MASVSFSRCASSGCTESAVSFSKQCWIHGSAEEILSNLRSGLENAQGPLILNLKKIECESLDFSKKNLQGSLLSQARFFRLPSELKAKTPVRDAFWYELLVEEKGRRHSVRRCEPRASRSFQKCVRWVQLTATQRRVR